MKFRNLNKFIISRTGILQINNIKQGITSRYPHIYKLDNTSMCDDISKQCIDYYINDQKICYIIDIDNNMTLGNLLKYDKRFTQYTTDDIIEFQLTRDNIIKLESILIYRAHRTDRDLCYLFEYTILDNKINECYINILTAKEFPQYIYSYACLSDNVYFVRYDHDKKKYICTPEY